MKNRNMPKQSANAKLRTRHSHQRRAKWGCGRRRQWRQIAARAAKKCRQLEAAETKVGPVPKGPAERWYCDQRKVAVQPFEWTRFLPGAEDVGLPMGGSTVLVAARGCQGKVLKVPRHFRYDQTAELFRQHGVDWWAYMPAMPLHKFDETRALTHADFFCTTHWNLANGADPDAAGQPLSSPADAFRRQEGGYRQ